MLFFLHLLRSSEQDDNQVRVITDTLMIHANRVIVTLPPALAHRLEYDPPLPEGRNNLIQDLKMGSVIKVMVIYETPFWREEGLSGQVLSDTGTIQTFYDNSPPDGSCGVLLGFIEGEQARWLRCLGHEVRKRLTVECLQTHFGAKAANYQNYLEKNWLTDPWSQGGYCGHFGPGLWTTYGESLREPCGRIHWAGTETSSVWNGYMEGAVRSGERAAQEILVLPSPQETITLRAAKSESVLLFA